MQGAKMGLGAAYIRGIKEAIDKLGADVIIQMDSDGQHDPNVIKNFLLLYNNSSEVRNFIKDPTQNTTEQGTKYTDGSLLLIGDLEPGGEAYYGKSAEEGITQPVLLFPKIWVETLLGIYDDIPYAQ